MTLILDQIGSLMRTVEPLRNVFLKRRKSAGPMGKKLRMTFDEYVTLRKENIVEKLEIRKICEHLCKRGNDGTEPVPVSLNPYFTEPGADPPQSKNTQTRSVASIQKFEPNPKTNVTVHKSRNLQNFT